MKKSDPLRFVFDEGAIDAVLAHLNQCHAPGVAVGISHRGVPIYRKGFGLAHQELPVSLSTSMRMRIGSTSKHFTCLAYRLLCERGLASLDDSIRKYLPELHEVATEVTVRQLMSHVAGLRDSKDIVLHLSGPAVPVSSAKIVRMYRHVSDRNFEPGCAWLYNNGGYQLISAAIERIADASLEEVLRRTVFEPAGLVDTMLRRRDCDFVPNSAALHIREQQDGISSGGTTYRKRLQGVAASGEGGIVSTVDDMLRWLAELGSARVFASGIWKELTTPYVLRNGLSTGYGMGLMVQDYRGTKIIQHGGTVRGGNSQMLKAVDLDLDIVIIANRDDVSSAGLVEQLLDCCIAGLPPKPQPVGDPIEQTFVSAHTGRVVQFFDRDGRQMAAVDGSEMLLEPAGAGCYRTAGPARHIHQVFNFGPALRYSIMELMDFGDSDHLTAVQLPGDIDPIAIAGRFASDSLGVELTVGDSAQGVAMISSTELGSVEYHLEPLTQHIWSARPAYEKDLGCIVSFARDRCSLRLSTSRNRALHFVLSKL